MPQGSNPFTYDPKSNVISYNKDFDKSKFEPEQLELVNRYTTLIDSKIDMVNVSVVNYNEIIPEVNKSLKDYKASGVTIPYSISEGKVKVGTVQNIFLARDPQKTSTNALRDEIDIPKKSWYRGLTSIHEIAGHGYLNVTKPSLDRHSKNKLVEDYETKVRKFYMYNGAPVKGFGNSHKEE